MANPNTEAVESYLNGLKQKDLSNVPFAPDHFWCDPGF